MNIEFFGCTTKSLMTWGILDDKIKGYSLTRNSRQGDCVKNSEITRAKLINLLYDYARIHKCPSARITFRGKRVNLYLGKGKNAFNGISTGAAYRVLKKHTEEKKSSGGNGYIGRSMSINAKRAYERGLKPLSRITSADLKQNGFYYPVRFFRWLVRNWDIKPKEMHHTSAACNITAFYDGSVIRYIVGCCNLELLYQLYKENLTMEQARQERQIRYAKARILNTLLSGRAGKTVNVDGVLCDNYLLLSPKLCIRADSPGVEIVEVFDRLPEAMRSENLEEITDGLIKHKTRVYSKFLK